MRNLITYQFMALLMIGILIIFIYPVKDAFPFVQADEVKEEDIGILTHHQIVEKTERFMNLIVQDIDENYRVIHFNTIDDLLNAFTEVSTKEVAFPFVDFYFTEHDDGLYLLPTETPPWFVPENDYDMIQLNNKEYIINQTNESILYGKYTIEIRFTYDKGWKITEINLI